jgi:hypothetical protein
MAKVKCPGFFCGSTNVVPVSTKNNFKVGKALVGNTIGFALGGPVGGIIGAATGFNGKKKVKFVCQDCGKVFEVNM